MPAILKNVLAVVAGLIIGSVINMGIIMVSGQIIPPPSGADVTTVEGLKASMHLFTPVNFLFPFLAHALGTLAGSAVAARFAATRRLIAALIVGLFFLAGGTANVFMLPSPLWFTITNLGLAYLPMAYIGYKVSAPKES